MKYATTLILTILIGILTQSSLKAQNIDTGRMNRDVRVMETILQELFIPHVGKNKKLGILSFGRNSDEINGSYLPNYGVIFVIQGQVPAAIPQVISMSNDSSFYFKLNTESGNEKDSITKKTIIKRIQQFLQTYGPTIGQLKKDDRITVIYQANSGGNGLIFINNKNKAMQISDRKRLPAEISVSVRKANLAALNRGSINQKQFNNRSQVSTSEKAGSKHNDIRVMAKIIKTVFQNDNHKFSISDPVHHLYVKGLGALFFTDASYGSFRVHILNGTILNGEIPESNKVVVQSLASLDTVDTSINLMRLSGAKKSISNLNKMITGINAKVSDSKKQEEKEFNQFLNQLKQTLVDYGRTIRSISSNESIFIMVNLTNEEYLPDHLELQLSRPALRAYGQGKISRDQAIDKIRVRKY